jgi:hypothetical protein
MTKLEQDLFNRASDLAQALAEMHGVLFCLIADLRDTELSEEQDALLNAAEGELRASQRKFLAEYAAEMGGAAPERN